MLAGKQNNSTNFKVMCHLVQSNSEHISNFYFLTEAYFPHNAPIWRYVHTYIYELSHIYVLLQIMLTHFLFLLKFHNTCSTLPFVQLFHVDFGKEHILWMQKFIIQEFLSLVDVRPLKLNSILEITNFFAGTKIMNTIVSWDKDLSLLNISVLRLPTLFAH